MCACKNTIAGHEALKLFSTYLNSPHHMNKKSYQKLGVGGDSMVSVDGTWQQPWCCCCHHGVVTAISTVTGKCFNTCCQTFVMAASDRKENKQCNNYLKCTAKHGGTASSME